MSISTVRQRYVRFSWSLCEFNSHTSQCAALRSELQLTRKHLSECEQARDKYHDDLVATQNRIERSLSQTVLAVESKAALSKTTNGDAEDTQRKPSSPSVSGSVMVYWWGTF
jgi:hypothetical protein